MTIYLIAIDRLPALSLGCYGCWQHATPNLDAQATRSLVCDNFIVWAESDCLAVDQSVHHFEITAEHAAERSGGADSLLDEIAEAGFDHFELLNEFLLDPAGLDKWNPAIPLALRLSLHECLVEGTDRAFGELREELQGQLREGDVVVVYGRTGELSIDRSLSSGAQSLVHPETQHLPLMIEFVGAQEVHGRLHEPLGVNDFHDLLKSMSEDSNAMAQWKQRVEEREQLILLQDGIYMIRTTEWLCIAGDNEEFQPQLFHLPEDPWGLLNVAPQYPHVVQELCVDLATDDGPGSL
ncbi:MAG: hypothetical protein KDA66_14255 [Planctomycetaceae bacterium]|nr:hypothetical protein [Planctomycetaceae bacterium]